MLGALSTSSHAEPARRQAVFVVGEDRQTENAFLAAGTRYYEERLRGEDLLVTQAQSWSDIREWLARSRARGDQPWGEIVVIAHGSQWTGASVPVFPGEKISRRSELDRLIDSQAFPPLDAAVADATTLLRVESCGVGRRPDLLDRYVRLLSGRTQGMQVSASEQLVEFGTEFAPGAPSWRRERSYQVTVHPGRRPTDRARAQSAGSGRRVIPAEMVLPLASTQCTTALRRLIRLPAVRTTLDDFGFAAGDLEWRILPGPASSCTLSGTAEVISSVPQQVGGIGS